MRFHGSLLQSLPSAATSPNPSTSFHSMASPFRHSSKAKELCGRRALLSFLAAAGALPSTSDSKNALLQEYLKRSRENKDKYDKERLDGYYKRNYKDYFELFEGSNKDKSDDLLSETEKEIRQWLQRNNK